MNPSRVAGAAAVCANAVPAGIIASSSGSAIVAPAPFNTVRRDKCLRVRNIAALLRSRPSLLQSGLPSVDGRPLPERIARDDAEHDGREAVVIVLGGSHDRAHRGHVAV